MLEWGEIFSKLTFLDSNNLISELNQKFGDPTGTSLVGNSGNPYWILTSEDIQQISENFRDNLPCKSKMVDNNLPARTPAEGLGMQLFKLNTIDCNNRKNTIFRSKQKFSQRFFARNDRRIIWLKFIFSDKKFFISFIYFISQTFFQYLNINFTKFLVGILLDQNRALYRLLPKKGHS